MFQKASTIFGALVLVVNVVSVFPNIHNHHDVKGWVNVNVVLFDLHY